MIKQMIQVGIWSVALSFSISGYSQIKKEKQADKNFDRLAYVNAIKVYERLAQKGYVNTSILQNLGDAYYFNGKLVEANTWYTELFEGDYGDKNLSELPSEYYYRYAQTLKAVEEYKKSQELMQQFAVLEKQDSRVERLRNNSDYLAQIEKQTNRYEVKPLSINSAYSDYGGTIVGNQFVFTSARGVDHPKKNQIHSWTNESYTHLYSVPIAKLGLESTSRWEMNVETKVNEATAVFTQDAQTMYFTRNNSKTNGKSKSNKAKTVVLKLYKAVKQSDGTWGQIEALPFNSDDFNTAHPALTPDDKWLYFASDRQGTIGQSDLFRVALYENRGYGPIENLGKVINTEGRESFPFISADYQLYFASDGHPGLGGLDVFVSKLNPDGSFGAVVNMGTPINSSRDDFGFYWNSQQGEGFVSSNRVGGKGGDDIYQVIAKPCIQRVQGKVYDKNTNEIISEAWVIFSTDLNQKVDTIRSNRQGQYVIADLTCEGKYHIKAEKTGYNTVEISFYGDRESGVKTVDIGLERTEKPLQVNDDLFKRLQLKPIHFDFDKATIRSDASTELMKIVDVMKQYPKMKIDVRSHTDSKGNDAYNLRLSNKRAQATVQWLIEQGIDASRLTGKGYGETQLLNHCSNGVTCTAEEHQLNRRSEFIITQL